MQSRYLIDADAIVALVIPDDSGYEWAGKVMKTMRKGQVFYLSSYAYGEALTVVSMRGGLKKAIETARMIEEMKEIVIVDVEKKLREDGLEWFSKQTSKNSRFTDCVNMALMEKLGIKEIFSRDKHYKQNGFVCLGID